MAVHTEEFLAESEVLPNLYFASDKQQLEHLALRLSEVARFYVGYAGWQSGQLEAEMEAARLVQFAGHNPKRLLADRTIYGSRFATSCPPPRALPALRLSTSPQIPH